MEIDLNDVRKHGSVRDALRHYCDESDTMACGIIGMEFATSGPGPGWCKHYDVSDFARRALEGDYGATAYLDIDDGRLATRAAKDDDEDDDQEDDFDVEWTDSSVVEILCPDIDDALDYPEQTAELMRALATHHDASDLDAWRKLVDEIAARKQLHDALADAIEGIKIPE